MVGSYLSTGSGMLSMIHGFSPGKLLKSIGKKTGISFGKLTRLDPLRREEFIPTALGSVDDVTFF